MSVTLNKTPRHFSVLMQDGRIFGSLLTPTTSEERSALFLDAYIDCCDVYEVTAVDRYDAHAKAAQQYHRGEAIAAFARRTGMSYSLAETVYQRCRTWANSLTPALRACWLGSNLISYMGLNAYALTEVMREHGEL
ncbi:hypothetical protein ACH4VR_19920 [Streptomyces sp. NPDC020883]|uniref:hypothetical protein n=1 Tax=Streptomyces sp. NPDC020883 TaxID=3365099 RepID=UPI003798BE0E